MDDAFTIRYSLTNLLLNQYLLKHNINPLKYNFENFSTDFFENRKIKVKTNIPYIESDYFLAVTVKKKNKVKVFINPKLSKNRWNFSLCHELIHCNFDLSRTDETQTLANRNGEDGYYSKEEQEVEDLANLGAGIVMLPDISVVKYMETNISFYKMAEELKMSNAALYVRLIQFCMYHFGYDVEYSSRLITRFQNEGEKQHINMALSGFGSTIKNQILLDYENSI
ncbi:ImmA/IrrE family metallo-endopeptidase [Enterococcus sp. UD-01]|jgi:Zn-dependent peptidase ImmA (M78 family)|uniref:ImmA/IrrE family metallo-endopeptidase n=1 Tax=Enterococcus sp. UD-01 TaxID=3373911 RepID=UPI0038354B2B